MALSPIFEFADRFVDEQSALDPCLATGTGHPRLRPPAHRLLAARRTRHGLITLRDALADAGHARRHERRRPARQGLHHRTVRAPPRCRTTPVNGKRTMRAIAAPSSNLRGTFDLMARDGEPAWTNIGARLHAMPRSARRSARHVRRRSQGHGNVAARRQALAAADQCATWADNRWFDSLADEAADQRSDLSARCWQHLQARRRRSPTPRTATSPPTCATCTPPTRPPRTVAGRSATGSVCARCSAPTSTRRRCTSGRGPTSIACAREIAGNVRTHPARAPASPR